MRRTPAVEDLRQSGIRFEFDLPFRYQFDQLKSGICSYGARLALQSGV